MTAGIDSMPTSVGPVWRTIRERMCCTPLQRSHFDHLADVAAYVFPDRATTEYGSIAHMTDNGDVVVNQLEFSAISNLLNKELDLEQAKRIRVEHQRRLKRLHDCVLLGDSSPYDRVEAKRLWCSTSDAIAELAPYGLVTKILPDILHQRVASQSNDSNPNQLGKCSSASYPEHLSSRALIRDVRVLMDSWPTATDDSEESSLTQSKRKLLTSFCKRHVGHGPTAWEVPGYENVNYVWGLLDPAVREIALADLTGLSTTMLTDQTQWLERPMTQPTSWRQEVEYWTDHLDTQTTVLRWGFLVGELPQLAKLATFLSSKGEAWTISDLMMCTAQELFNHMPSVGDITSRRHAYRASLQPAGQVDHRRPIDQRSNHTVDESLSSQPMWGTSIPRQLQFKENGSPGETDRLIFIGESAAALSIADGDAWVSGSANPGLPPPHSIVVAKHLSPGLTPAILSADAVVVEEGGLLQHAVLVAREVGIPCIVGCRGIVGHLTSGTRITVDGGTGQVSINGTSENRA